jgi:hypothetical protein
MAFTHDVTPGGIEIDLQMLDSISCPPQSIEFDINEDAPKMVRGYQMWEWYSIASSFFLGQVWVSPR